MPSGNIDASDVLDTVSFHYGIGTENHGYGAGTHLTAPLQLSMAVVVLTLLLIVIVYPFMQKYFATGVLTGAIKG